MRVIIYLLFYFISISCNEESTKYSSLKDDYLKAIPESVKIIPGSDQSEQYLPLLKGKKVGLLVNQTSIANKTHLVDFLIQKKVKIIRIFVPEHGFRGTIDAGEKVTNNFDEKTGIPIISLYGKNFKPTEKQMKDLDIVIYDIQDVGVRFYTYISTLHYMMESCAQNNVKLLIFDRPNPNGDYIDGSVLKLEFISFVGKHPIPIVYGLSVGELAGMINGEKWLKDKLVCSLDVIKVRNYTHKSQYTLPVKPSPNLPNQLSVRLYPSLCFFEATGFSVGRGTEYPFQVIGFPDKKYGDFTFTPKSIQGMALEPILEGEKCFGIDLRNESVNSRFTLKYLLAFYQKCDDKKHFFSKTKWMNLLSGNDQLQKQILSGLNEEQIKESWKQDLDKYKKIRREYLLYEDFE